MKIIDILNKMANETLEDKFEFYFNDFHFIYFKSVNEIQRLENGINIGRIYYLDKHLNDEVEVIEEEEIEQIDELRIAGITTEEMENRIKLKEVLNDTLYDIKEKINELVRAVNKLNKEREEK